MKTHTILKKTLSLTALLCTCLIVIGHIETAHAQAVLVNQWLMDNPTTGYQDLVGSANMNQNPGTSTAFQVGGSPVNTSSVELGFISPGPATQLYSSAGQNNNFGFSFWVNPVYLGAYNNFIGKETTETSRPDWGSLAWQVHLLGDESGYSKLEFIVRGDSNASDFFGAVTTTTPVFKLEGDQPDVWVNIAGGYNNTTGELSLYVDGNKYVTAGTPWALTDSIAPFFAGTGFNAGHAGPVTYAAGTRMWDLRLYDSPLNQGEVDAIIAAVPEPQTWALLGFGALICVFFGRNRFAYKK